MMPTSPRASGISPSDHDLLIEALGQLKDAREDISALREWTESHNRVHATTDAAFQTHLREAARREVHDEEWRDLEDEVESLHDFKTQVITIGRMVQFIVGTSLIAALAAAASLVLTISHIIHPTGV